MLLWCSIFFFLVLGILDLLLFKRHVRMQPVKNHRAVYYLQCLLEMWVPTLLLASLVVTGQVNVHAIGLGWYQLERSEFPIWVSISLLGLSLLAILYLIVDLIRYQTNSQYRAVVDSKIQQVKHPAYFEDLKPITPAEKRIYVLLSLSAGVFEEILYRGYLISLLSDGWNNIWIAVVGAGLLFGMGHLYQGLEGILKTFLIGVVLGIIFAATGSLLSCIVLHILIDLSSIVYSYGGKSEKKTNPSMAGT